MLYVSSDNIVKLTRGDTARLSVSIFNDSSEEEYEIQENDKLTLSIKRNIKDEQFCMQKNIMGSKVFRIDPEDTNNLSFGKYKYDVELVTEAGDVYTIIEPTIFEILPEVTC